MVSISNCLSKHAPALDSQSTKDELMEAERTRLEAACLFDVAPVAQEMDVGSGA